MSHTKGKNDFVAAIIHLQICLGLRLFRGNRLSEGEKKINYCFLEALFALLICVAALLAGSLFLSGGLALLGMLLFLLGDPLLLPLQTRLAPQPPLLQFASFLQLMFVHRLANVS
jgi:hypothetical protein